GQVHFGEHGLDRIGLARAAVDQQHIGPVGHAGAVVLGVGVALGGKAGETAGEHFAHHAEVVPGSEVFRFDVKGAVVLFRQTFETGDHHSAHSIGALNVGVVVNLDAARWLVEAK